MTARKAANGASSMAPRLRRPYAARVPIEQRRDQLLDAAIAVIVRDGFDKVSIEAIASEAGVTRPVVYGAYDGLQPLLFALLDRQQARALAQLAERIPALTDLTEPESTVLQAMQAWMEGVVAEPLTWLPILAAQQGVPEPVRERIRAGRETTRQQFAAIIEAVFTAPDGSPLDAEVTSHMLLAILERFGQLLLEDPHQYEPERLVAALKVVITSLCGTSG